MKKTWLTALLTACMAVSLIGCGSGDNGDSSKESGKASATNAAGEKVKLSIWHNYTGDDLRAQTMRATLEQFQKDNPNIQLIFRASRPMVTALVSRRWRRRTKCRTCSLCGLAS